jgi:hypothetical protein
VSFGLHDLQGLAQYVERKKEHHGTNRVNATLERFGDFEEKEEVDPGEDALKRVEKPR